MAGEKGGLFSGGGKKIELFSSKPKAPAQDTAQTADIISHVTDISRRLRMVEESYGNVRKKIQMVEENMLDHGRKYNTEIKTQNSEISELRHEIEDIKSKIMLIIKELKLTAKKEDFEVVKKYQDLWEPVKFVTAEQVERIVKDMMKK